ncbi:DUF2796 domain-containing protein [Phaeobacter sp. JH20_02]|uniref:zinc uptake protein ZrgA n=1 Tax=unclassified Phaeobacter TaxID=2621772 RepID=UPI003A8A60E8
MKRTLSLLAIVTALPALAEGTRQLGAHEHGVGTLNIAIDGSTVLMEFQAPGADLVGFEHAAKSAADRSAVDAAIARLSDPLALFIMPDAARCSVGEASAKLETASDHGQDEHEDHAEDAGHDNNQHGHNDHEGHANDKHDDHEHEGHAEHHTEKADHAEFNANYILNCAEPASLTNISFAYFDAFPNAQKVQVQLVGASGAHAYQVERGTPILTLER